MTASKLANFRQTGGLSIPFAACVRVGGGTLVTAKVDDVQETEARAILLRTGAVDLSSRGRIYRETGWSSVLVR